MALFYPFSRFSDRRFLQQNVSFFYDNATQAFLPGIPCTKNLLSHRSFLPAFLGQYFVSLQNTMQRLARLSGAGNRSRVEDSNREPTGIILALLRDDFSGAADALRSHLNNGRISAYQVVLDGQSEDARKQEQ